MTTRLAFKKATKQQARLRMAIDGPSGAGKTYTALTFAFALAEAVGGKVAVIDTEHASAAKYADEFPDFDVLELDTFTPETYVEAIQLAEKAGYAVLIIDSLSHAWDGVDGALEQVDKAAARSRSGNSYTAWRDVTPLHRAMIEAILQSDCHIIATMRSKMEYVMDKDGSNKTEIRKVGLAPIQRQGMEYEFDVVADMDVSHKLVISKSRCSAVADAVQLKPTGAWMEPVIGWLTSGEAIKVAAPTPEPPRARASDAPEPQAWVTDHKRQTAFWAWSKGDKGLKESEIHEALGVKSLLEFAGSERDAAHLVNMFIEAHAGGEDDGANGVEHEGEAR